MQPANGPSERTVTDTNLDTKLTPPPRPTSFDWVCETLQISALGAPLASVWAATNVPTPYQPWAIAVCAAVAFISARYLKLCTPVK